MNVQLSTRIPYAGQLTKREVIDLVRIADEAGFHSGWVGDHVVYPAMPTSSRNDTVAGGVYPGDLMAMPSYEALIVLAVAAAASDRLKLGLGCCVVPQREPLLLAKQVASLDNLAQGRMIFGAVGGWLREEFEAMGAPFTNRGARLEEAIALMRTCWEEDRPSWTGTYYAFDSVHFLPKPAQYPMPIWFGGRSSTSLKRAATIGDGWSGSLMKPDEVRRACTELAAYRAESQRSREPFTVMAACSLDAAKLPGRAEVIDLVSEYDDTGLDVLLIHTDVRDPGRQVAVIAAVAEALG